MVHATTRRSLRSILVDGRLRADKSKVSRRAVYLATPAQRLWAVDHVARRHGVKISDVVLIEVNVPRTWLRRHNRSLWYCMRDIPVPMTAKVTGLVEVAV